MAVSTCEYNNNQWCYILMVNVNIIYTLKYCKDIFKMLHTDVIHTYKKVYGNKVVRR